MTNPLEQRSMGLALFINHLEQHFCRDGQKFSPEIRAVMAMVWHDTPYQRRKRHIVHITKSNKERRIH